MTIQTIMLPQDKLTFPYNLLNATGETLSRLGLTLPRLDADDIQRRAMQATGLTDFGNPHYVAGLEALMAAGRSDELNFFGRLMIGSFALDCARTRLEWMETQKQQPEAFATELTPPIIVIGLPRSGTTFLHRMLAADPTHQSIPKWRLMKPFPPTNGRSDNRYETIVKNEKVLQRLRPELNSKHVTSADVAEECMLIQSLSFNSAIFYAAAPVFTYLEWFLTADRHAMYQEYASVLRWYQHEDSRRLVMKSPSHMSDLPALMTAVPNALIVQTHRDPVKVINSVNSLFHTLHTMLMKPYVPEKMVEANLRYMELLVQQNQAARETLNHNICDIFYDELVANPVGAARKIYTHFGLAWTDEKEQQLSQYIADNPRGKHGVHQYSAADFGLTDAQIRERFADYIERFNVGTKS